MACVLAATAIGLFTAAHAVAAEPQAPTVTFTATGTPGPPCGSRPSVTSIQVPEATPVLVANSTVLPATLLVGGVQTVPGQLQQGGAVLLTLAPGQHVVKLVPPCGTAEPLTVLVVAEDEPDGPEPTAPQPTTAPPTAPPSSVAGPPPTTSGAGTPTSGQATGPSRVIPVGTLASQGPSSTAATASGSAGAAADDSSTGVAPIGLAPGVIAAEAMTWQEPDDPKGVRLLAVIATICLLGVTAAIIRSIVRLSP